MHELSVILFARTSRRVELTAAGESFLTAARTSLEAAERAVSDAASATGQIRGTLTIGMIPTVTAIDIPAALSAFHRAHAAVRITLRDGSSDQFKAGIADSTMDIAVLGLPDAMSSKGVNTRVLSRQRLVAVVSADHRLADRRRIRLDDLADESLVDFPEGTPGRVPSDLSFQTAGLRREVAFEAMSADLILDLVRHNLVVTLLSPVVLRDDPGIRAIPVIGGPTRIECLAWNTFNPSPAAEAFLNLVRLGADSQENGVVDSRLVLLMVPNSR